MAKKRQPNLSSVIKSVRTENTAELKKLQEELEKLKSDKTISDFVLSDPEALEKIKNAKTERAINDILGTTYAERRLLDISEKTSDDPRIAAILGRLSDLEKNVKGIETTSLAIMEILRRKKVMESDDENTTNLKKKSKTVIEDKQYDLDPDLPLGEYYKNALMKIYKFMTKNAEKEKREKDTQKGLKKEKQQERKRKYEKAEKKLTKKKSGFLGAAFKVGAISAAIGGVVWLFKEEVKAFGESIVGALASIGEAIGTGFNYLKSVYQQIQQGIQVFTESIMKSPIGGYIQKMKDWIESKFSGEDSLIDRMGKIFDYVDKSIKSVYDMFDNWISDIMDNVIAGMRKFTDPGDILALFLSSFGGKVGKTISTALFAKKASKFIESQYNKKIYGKDYYKKLEEAVDGVEPDKLKNLVANHLQMMSAQDLQDWFGFPASVDHYIESLGWAFNSHTLSEDEKNDIINMMIKSPALMNSILKETKISTTSAHSDMPNIPVANAGQKIADEARGILKNRAEEIIKYLPEQYEVLSTGENGITIKDKVNNTEINSENDPVQFMRIVMRNAVYGPLSETKSELEKFKKSMSDYEEQMREDFRRQQLIYEEETGRTASRMRETISSGLTAVRDRPIDTVASVGSAVYKPAKKAAEDVSKKAEKIDYFKLGEDAYKDLVSSFDKLKEQTGKLDSFGKIEEYVKNLTNDNRVNPVGEDPNDMNQTLSRMNQAVTQASNFTFNSVRNLTQSTSETFDNIPMGTRDDALPPAPIHR